MSPRRRWKRLGIGLAVVVALWAIAGFLVVPPLARRAIEKNASEALRREVTVAAVRFNPFTLRVSVRGLAVRDRDGGTLLAWELLSVRARPTALLRRNIGVAELRLVKPQVRVALDREGRPSFRDLLDAPAEPEPPAPAKDEAPGFGLEVGLLSVEQARLAFVDGTHEPAFEKVLGPASLRLADFVTRAGGRSDFSFAAATESGERLAWNGTLEMEPIRAAGTLELSGLRLERYRPYTREQLPAEVRAGTAGLKARYDVLWGPQRQSIRLRDGSLTVEGLRVGRAGVADDDVQLPSFSVTGVEVDALGRSAEVGAVWLRGGVVRARREADGEISLRKLLPGGPEPGGATEAAPPPPGRAAPAAPEPAFAWKVKTAGVEGLRVEWTDLLPKQPVSVVLEPIAVKAEELRPGADATWPVSFSTGVNGRGTVSVRGAVAPFALRGEVAVEVEALDLAPVGPYTADAPVQLIEGKLGVRGRATFDAGSGEDPRWSWKGDVRLEGAKANETAHGGELVRWRSLEVAGIEAASTPLSARISAIRLADPVVRFVSHPGRPGRAAPAPEPAQAKSAPLPPLSLGLLRVQRGRATYVDRAVQPPVVLETTGIDASLANLSTSPRGRSRVDVRALVGGAAPLTVAGTLNPLRADALTDLVVRAKGIDLVPLGPYAGKHLGYGLAKGKLDLDVHVKVQDRALSSSDVVRIDQLTLGEKTDSPDAVSLPVKLALAVVRDRNGVILVDLPVEGSLDDPEFRFGRAVLHVLVSALAKAATAPFSALASLVGGEQADLSVLELAPGGAQLDEEGLRRVGQLARALQERPDLGLEIEGTLDDARDREALARAALAQRLARAKSPAGAAAAAAPSPAEHAGVVAALYRAQHPTAPPGESVQQMEAKLLAAIEVPADALRALAAERGGRARDAVLAAGVDAARVFLVEGGDRARQERGARVYFTLQPPGR